MSDFSRDTKTAGVAFLSGVAAGYVLSLLLPDEYTSKSKKQLRKIKMILTDPKEQQRIKEIFQEQTNETVANYHMVKDRLARNLHSLRKNYEEISKEKYYSAIQDALDYAAEYQEFPTPQINALKKYLQNDFNRVKTALQTND